MPKDRRNRAPSSERSAHAPFPCSSSGQQKNPPPRSSPHPPEQPATAAEALEWDETRCPVCMDHPHNAVLLLCSSHERGCRAYMCDTSYRHSNCLDQFRKASSSYVKCQDGAKRDKEGALDLSCPLCRGVVKNWVAAGAARRYMNTKTRACSLESCDYSGAYGELRRHARLEHPAVRPADADPERQRDWRRMQWQRDMGDLLTTINPLFAGGRETGNVEGVARPAVYASPRLLISLPVRVPLAQVIISFAARTEGFSSDGGGNRRRRTHSHWGEIFDGADDASGGGDTGDEDDATEAQSADRSGQPRHGRRV